MALHNVRELKVKVREVIRGLKSGEDSSTPALARRVMRAAKNKVDAASDDLLFLGLKIVVSRVGQEKLGPLDADSPDLFDGLSFLRGTMRVPAAEGGWRTQPGAALTLEDLERLVKAKSRARRESPDVREAKKLLRRARQARIPLTELVTVANGALHEIKK